MLAEDIRETDIPLDTVAAHTEHAHLALRDSGGGKRIARRAGVAFHVIITGRTVHALGHIEIGQAVMLSLRPATS